MCWIQGHPRTLNDVNYGAQILNIHVQKHEEVEKTYRGTIITEHVDVNMFSSGFDQTLNYLNLHPAAGGG